MRTVIRNGTVVNADGRVEADVVIEGSLIVEVVAQGRENVNADVEIDAAGMYVIPGGVDPHVHLELPEQLPQLTVGPQRSLTSPNSVLVEVLRDRSPIEWRKRTVIVRSTGHCIKCSAVWMLRP